MTEQFEERSEEVTAIRKRKLNIVFNIYIASVCCEPDQKNN